jgi:polysaccharide export outer membrane protein
MNIKRRLATMLLCLCPPLAVAESAYTLKEGDTLDISVWGEEDLSREILVLPDGSISFPLVGNLQAGGLTAPELREKITEGISDYIPDATVSVVVAATEGNRVYVLGNVARPGSFILRSPLNVMQALSLAGGLTTFADKNDILIIRDSDGTQTRLPVRYNDIVSGKSLQTNLRLIAGDTVLVP